MSLFGFFLVFFFSLTFIINQLIKNFPSPPQFHSLAPLLPVLPHPSPPPIHSLSLLFRKVQAFLLYPSAMGYQVPARLGTSSPLRLHKETQQEKKVPRTGNRAKTKPSLSQCQESHKKIKTHNCNTCAEDTGQSHAVQGL